MTHIVCVVCGHVEPVAAHELPRRCEWCRESFAGNGYYLIADEEQATKASEEVIEAIASDPDQNGPERMRADSFDHTKHGVDEGPLVEQCSAGSLTPATGR